MTDQTRIESNTAAFLDSIAVGGHAEFGSYLVARRAADLFIIDDDAAYGFERTVEFLSSTGAALSMFTSAAE